MATKRRYLRCPQCMFEHTVKREPKLIENGQIAIPSSCPRCGWTGEIHDDGGVSRNLPLPNFPLHPL